jgi:hypothetical protein
VIVPASLNPVALGPTDPVPDGRTPVRSVVVAVFRARDSHPAYFSDPVGRPKHPVGSIEVTGALDDDGNWRGSFEELLLPEAVAGEELVVFAFVDVDDSSIDAPANLQVSPLTRNDLIVGTLPRVIGPLPPVRVETRDLVLDRRVDDLDFDGVYDDDRDGDGKPDDNCPTVPNTDQADLDGDGVGDLCDDCPDVADPDQPNLDGVGKGDRCNDSSLPMCPSLNVYPVAACPIDSDGDEIDDNVLECVPGVAYCQYNTRFDWKPRLDNCLWVDNPDQSNVDNDEFGDACDEDDDNDGLLDAEDNCPLVANNSEDDPQTDSDNDGIGDACDLCPNQNDADQRDSDGDGVGDACDSDGDGDGICDPGRVQSYEGECTGQDNCPFTPNPAQADRDGDGSGDACDLCPERTLITEDEDLDGTSAPASPPSVPPARPTPTAPRPAAAASSPATAPPSRTATATAFPTPVTPMAMAMACSTASTAAPTTTIPIRPTATATPAATSAIAARPSSIPPRPTATATASATPAITARACPPPGLGVSPTSTAARPAVAASEACARRTSMSTATASVMSATPTTTATASAIAAIRPARSRARRSVPARC